MKNNKGYTLVEVLAVVTIVAILSVVTIVGYTRYVEKSKKETYDGLAKSAYHAAQQYAMTNPSATSVTLANLVDGNLLENYKDPSTGGNCEGSIVIISGDTYQVKLCCSEYKYIYTFPGNTKELTTCN